MNWFTPLQYFIVIIIKPQDHKVTLCVGLVVTIVITGDSAEYMTLINILTTLINTNNLIGRQKALHINALDQVLNLFR